MRKIKTDDFCAYPTVKAAFLTILLLLLIYCFSGLLTLNGKNVLVCDMFGQYYDFLLGFKKIIIEDKSLVYSWNLDMGMNIIGWIAYYLSSPFNLILLIVPNEYFTIGIMAVIIIKLTCAAISFSLFSKKVLHAGNVENLIYSVFYALSGYSVTYFFHIFWLDSIILLPVVMITLKTLIEKNKITGMIISLFLVIVTNYYMGYMVGIFTLICFIAYYKYKYKKIFSKKFLKTLFLLAISAGMAFLLGAFLFFPTIHQMIARLGEGHVDVAKGFINFNFFEFYEGFMTGSYTTLMHGKPLIYCGLISVLLIPFYYGNIVISKKEKKIMGGLLITMYFMMAFPITDLIMHLGNVPTGFLYRYSYFFSFLICIIGVRQFPYMLDDFKNKKVYFWGKIILLCNVMFICIRYIMAKVNKTEMFYKVVENKYYLCSLIVIILYYILARLFRKGNIEKKQLIMLMFMIISFDIVSNGVMTMKKIDKDSGFEKVNTIKQKESILNKQLKNISKDTQFYRVDKNYKISYNDGIGYGYNSISNFSSVYNVNAHSFLQNMGIKNWKWSSQYLGSTVYTDSILSVKYILHKNHQNYSSLLFDESQTEEFIQENEYWLPIGFMVNSKIIDYKLHSSDIISSYKQQQALLMAMTGEPESEKCFGIYKPNKKEYCNIKINYENDYVLYSQKNKAEPGIITYSFEQKNRNRRYYYYPQMSCQDNEKARVIVHTDYSEMSSSNYSDLMFLKDTFNIKLFENEATLKDNVYIKVFDNTTLKLQKEWFYYLDLNEYQKYHADFIAQSLKVNKFEDGFIEGNVNVKKGNEIMFLSIPYDVGWKAYVDGEKTDIIPLCSDAFIGIKIGKGSHDLQLIYEAPWLKEGIVVSFIAVILIIVSVIIKKVIHNLDNK